MRRRWWTDPPQGEGLVDVELIDGPAGQALPDDAPLAGPRPSDPETHGTDTRLPPPGDRSPPERVKNRRTRWWAGAVAAVAVVAVVGANVAEVRRTGALRAALEETPGFVTSLAEPLQETWRVQGSVVGATDDALVLSTVDGSTEAVDPVTGEVRWTRRGAGLYYCPVVGVLIDDLTGMPLSEPDGAAGQQLLACTVAGGVTDTDAFGPVVVEVMDARTGEVRSTLSTTGALLGTIPFERDVALMLVTAEGHLRLARWDPATGEPRFDETTPEPVVPAGTMVEGGWLQTGDTLTVFGAQPVVLSLTTGLEVPTADATAGEWTIERPMPDGGVVTWTFSQTGAGRGQVADADGTVRFELTDSPWWALTTDGSVPEVMLVIDDAYTRVRALDTRTGDELWTLQNPGGQPLVQVDGVLVMTAGTVSTAIDVRDGSTLWSVPTASTYMPGLTDGSLVGLIELADPERSDPDVPDTAEALVARALEDGEERWRTLVPPGTYYIDVRAGHVLGHTGDGVFGLG